MARVAAALALAFLVQGAFAAPSLCGCYPGKAAILPAGLSYADSYADASAYGPYPYGSYPALDAAAYAAPDAYAPLPYSPVAPLAPLAPLAYGPDVSALSYAAPTVSSPAVPVGPSQVVSTSAGPASAYTTPPVCQTSSFEVPVKSNTIASSGPVKYSSAVVDGCCSNACAATRARCSGTTKNVSFKTPKIINKGSRTSSSVTPIGNAVTTRSTSAGKPEVSTTVSPAPAPYGPYNSYLDAPAYGAYPYADAAAPAYGAYPYADAYGAYPYADAYGAYPYADAAAPAYLDASPAYLPASPAYLPGPYPCSGPVAYPKAPIILPTPSPKVCACY